MTNRQVQVGKFSPTRSEQPKFNPNWWVDLPKTHPLANTAPTRQQRRAGVVRLQKWRRLIQTAGDKVPGSPNRHERRKMASILRKAARKAAKGNRK